MVSKRKKQTKGQVAVLADNKGPELAVADNIRNLVAYYRTLCKISNWQFCLYYIFIAVWNITEGGDNYVAQGRQNSLKKKNVSGFSGQITHQITQQNDR